MGTQVLPHQSPKIEMWGKEPFRGPFGGGPFQICACQQSKSGAETNYMVRSHNTNGKEYI